MPRWAKVTWNESDDKRLIAEFPIVGAPKMAARLGKSIWHVRKRSAELGLKWHRETFWKKDKVKKLADDYYTLGGPVTSAKYGITTSTITYLIFKEGFQRPGWKWNRREDQVVIDLYPSAPYSKILAKLPGRTVTAIRSRAALLGVRRPNIRFREIWKA